MRNVGAEGFFERISYADAGKERTPKREILIPENFLSGRKRNTFATVL